MIINKVKIYQFRSFLHYETSFSKGLNILSGLNAVGKTSVLEAISYLSITKSFKTKNDTELINDKSREMSVIGIIDDSENKKKIQIVKKAVGKQVFVNQEKIKRISDFLGEFLTVAYSNDDLIKFVGSPSERRKIIEPIICQISKVYTHESNYYKKLLNERNTLLKRLIFENSKGLINVLEVINNQLVVSAKKIIEIRKQIIKELNEIIPQIHNQISSEKEDVKIEYLPSVNEEEMLQELNKNYDVDLKRGSTSVGPHRDDYVFIINNKNCMIYGSQGQQRNMLISLKLAFVELIKKYMDEYPVLLLDDVFAELDQIRQNKLITSLNKDVQTIISTATLKEIDPNILEKANIITLNKRSV